MMFYKETNFKETPIGKVPKDWIIEKLGALCKFKRGFSYRSSQITPSRTQIRFLTINDIEKEGGLKREAEKLYIREDVEIDPEFFVNEGDVFIANTDMAKGFIIGAPILMKNIDEKYVYSMDLTKLIFNKAEVDSGFLFYYLTHSSMRRRMKAAAQGTNVLHLNHVIIRNFFIPLPPFPEQQKIAEILSTVDEAIQKTNEIIAKTERLKNGLMQELLTKGIGHKEFKDTEIGRIPKDWEVVKLGDGKIAEIRGNRTINNIQKVAFIPMELVPDHEIFAKYEIRDLKDISSSTYCEAGDLLLAKITPSLENGKQGIVPEDVPNGFALATTEVYPIVCKGINRLFLFYVLKFPKFRKILEFSMRGTTGRQRVPKDAVEKLKIPLPPDQEQQKIAEILSTVDKKLEIERKEKARLEKIKQGLMDLLLTGKVRVKVN
jgi:type I restriction enzyme S subunit